LVALIGYSSIRASKKFFGRNKYE